ncbi:leucyl aminopeptidase [Methylocaldum sp.]|uniref:leucyl aminopeptidase n=1 Tax=Methylocaldum sp. TaxID=1969727 RepID=UPI002D2B7F94|nr:leucyl aminopeptidase [Methylocaldum sp.]HYE35001.1 leucyl aminopeptidase [Methylocaldum sp.]
MDYSAKCDSLDTVTANCAILGFHQKRKLTSAGSALDDHLGGLISKLLKRDDIEGKVGDILLINHVPDGDIERILLVGLGKKGELGPAAYRKALTTAAKLLKDSGAKLAVSLLHEPEVEGRDLGWKVRQAVEILEGSLYKFTRLKNDADDKPQRLSKLQFLLDSEDQLAEAKLGIRQGQAIANGMNIAKDLANLPGNLCTPTYLAEQAEQMGKSRKIKVRILDESDLEELNMGAFLSVSKGSEQPAKLIVMEYSGASSKAKPFVLIGKGLTFDAGGISLKPAANMDEMKYDMCGGASVIGTLSAVAELELPLNVVGLVPASENLPDGRANKPGDIVKSMSGLSIEILNTDAEGRLLLCDTLTYAKKYEPAAVVDVATLTGACIVALGRHPSGLWSNNEDLAAAVLKAGEASWDRVWRMPLWEEYQELLKSNFADVANIGGPDGGSITAACFLSRFAKEFPWAHVDIAGTAWKSGSEKGATGRPVPLLVQYLVDQAK